MIKNYLRSHIKKITSQNGEEGVVQHILEKIYNNGHLKKGFKPVNWCVKIQSALAEAEVEYKEKESTAIDVKFKITSSNSLEKIFGMGIFLYNQMSHM